MAEQNNETTNDSTNESNTEVVESNENINENESSLNSSVDNDSENEDNNEDKDWKAEAEKWKSNSRKNEVSAKENFKKLNDLQTEFNSLKDKITEFETVKQNNNDLLKRAIIAETGLPNELAARLKGDTEEDLKNDAAELLELFKNVKKTPKPISLQGSDDNSGDKPVFKTQEDYVKFYKNK